MFGDADHDDAMRALMRDAARYRALRDVLTWDVAPADSDRPARAAWSCRFVVNYGMTEHEDSLDSAVDELARAHGVGGNDGR